MRHTPIITEEMLDGHADYAESRGLIPELLFRLISASIRSPIDLRFPVGGSIGQPGADGRLNAQIGLAPYVPSGLSFWETGTGDPARKARDDYSNRTEKVEAAERANATFVFVTMRSGSRGWDVDKQEKWISEKTATNDWRAIKIIDGTKLAQWISDFPEIDFWLASRLGLPVDGLDTPARHWEVLKSYGEPPPLLPMVFMTGRETAAAMVLEVFRADRQELLIETRYPQEGIDFVAAVLASLDQESEAALASRGLIVRDPSTWEAFCALKERHVLIASPQLDLANTGTDLRQRAKLKNHGVIFTNTPMGTQHGNSTPLHRISPSTMATALVTSGYSDGRAHRIADRAGGEPTVLKRLLQDISAAPPWTLRSDAAELAVAALIGEWRGATPGDHEIVESLAGKAYGEWTGVMHQLTLLPDPPLAQRNDSWKFISRFEGWQYLGKYQRADDLKRWAELAASVLRELDPRLELPVEDRFAASIHGKVRRYSESLRRGLAETLALMGTFPNALASCPPDLPETIADSVVRRVLSDADTALWASLNDVLPLLAEASPHEFLSAYERALETKSPSPFLAVFGEETGALFGANFMTGSLWGLETLAWSPKYLTRAAVVLGGLASLDPGGRWANRPDNSLTTIFLPWLPQTCAAIPERVSAIRTLLRERPTVGWQLLLSLLPSLHGISFGSRKPAWREFIPPDHPSGSSRIDAFEQVKQYSQLAAELAADDPAKLHDLIKRFDNLPPVSRRAVLSLVGTETAKQPEEVRLPIWEAMITLAHHHRAYHDADWAMPDAQVRELEEAADRVRPTMPRLQYRHLFTETDFDLMDHEGTFAQQQDRLQEQRDHAVANIVQTDGISGIERFAESVGAPWQVGIALGRSASQDIDPRFLQENLGAGNLERARLAAGFIVGRFQRYGWGWVDTLNATDLTPAQRGELLAPLPFGRDTWRRVTTLLGGDAGEYWSRTSQFPFARDEEIVEGATQLLKFGRPKAAVDCLAGAIHQHIPFAPALAAEALTAQLSSPEQAQDLDRHHTLAVLKWLQEQPSTDQDALFRLEWLYLPILDQFSDTHPVALSQQLAANPQFFCELIRVIFKPRHRTTDLELSPDEQDRAKHAYQLLQQWRRPPGTQNGRFDPIALRDWVRTAMDECGKSDHLEVAMLQVGQVLSYGPPDENGLWVHTAIAEILNQPGSAGDNLREGFSTALFNRRGVHTYTAGDAEHQLAAGYYEKAKALDDHGFQRIAATVCRLGEYYERDAKEQAARGDDD